ncbi:MAG: hypothetical protein Q9Q40_08520 [Acidobacteriota bacterium]|nr:hypothetical protein [Acidobacteriota bacterium]MDQ7088980.1 hypothetical protein [Acidobacteriota bacterium]
MTLRVSDSQAQQDFLRNLRRVRADMFDALDRMNSGKRIRYASDDPYASSALMRLQEDAQLLEARRRGISQSRAWLELSEQGVSQMGDVLNRGLTYALQASSETNQQSGLDAIAEQVSGLINQVRTLANYRVSGNYIFSGTMTDRPPYDDTGAYQGNDSAIRIPLDGQNLEINFTADELFGVSGVSGPLELLERFEAALQAGDTDAIQGMVEEFRDAGKQNTTILARIGTRRRLLEEADIRIQNKQLEISERAAELGSADMAEAISDATRLQTGYQATLAAGARIFGPSFFDYLS